MLADAFGTEVAKQVPALAVLVGLVVYFLKSLDAMASRHEKRMEHMSEQHESRVREMSERQETRMRDVINSQDAALTKTNQLCDHVLLALGRIPDRDPPS